MGWTYTHKPAGQSASEFLREHFTEETDKLRWEMLDIAIVRFRTAYAAVRKTNKLTGDSLVFGLVCLLDHRPADEYNFGWKEIEESMGPVESDCPARILDLLTPTKAEFAIEWRARCRENLAKRDEASNFMHSLRPGDRLRYEPGLTFSSGAVLHEFTLLSKKPLRFADGQGAGRYAIPRKYVLQMTKIESTAGDSITSGAA